MVTLGSQFTRIGRMSITLDLTVASNHAVRIDGARPEFNSFEVHSSGLYRFNRTLSAGPLGGLSYRNFLQDGVQIQQVIMPELGGVASLTLLGGRWWGIRLVTRATLDLGTVQLQPAGDTAESLSHYSIKSYLCFVFGDRVDPFVPKRTSRK